MHKFALTKPLIYLITEGIATDENFSEKSAAILNIIEKAVAAEISLVQIREKKLSARMVFELTRKAARITRETKTKLLVNDRADIALLARADGVHLTSGSLAAAVIRRHFPKNFIIGVSAHSLAAAEKADDEGADFVTFSPIFRSPQKGAPQGLANLREVCKKIAPFPVIALGGIDGSNYKSVLAAGAHGFAAIRFLNDVDNLPKIAAEIKAK